MYLSLSFLLPNVRVDSHSLSLCFFSHLVHLPPPCSTRARMRRREEKGVFVVGVGVIAKFGHSWDLNSPPRRHRCPQRGRTFSSGEIGGQIFASLQIRIVFLSINLGKVTEESFIRNVSLGVHPSLPSLIRPSRVEGRAEHFLPLAD